MLWPMTNKRQRYERQKGGRRRGWEARELRAGDDVAQPTPMSSPSAQALIYAPFQC